MWWNCQGHVLYGLLKKAWPTCMMKFRMMAIFFFVRKIEKPNQERHFVRPDGSQNETRIPI